MLVISSAAQVWAMVIESSDLPGDQDSPTLDLPSHRWRWYLV